MLRDSHLGHFGVRRERHLRLKVDQARRGCLLKIWQQPSLGGKRVEGQCPRELAKRWKRLAGCLVVVHRQADLPDVVRTLRSPCRLPCRLHRWQEQADERGDDRDHHEEFNELKTRL